MAMPGDWTLHYNAGCTDNYATTAMTFKPDGTWSMPSWGYTGQWVEVSGEIIFNFNVTGSKTIYAGNVAGSVAAGILSTFTGVTGCWYLTKEGAAPAKTAGPSIDPSGKPTT
ncbi:MAG TPA: hypothetical protein VGG03_22905 [Thermoanaerobaculia bacterium]|jgi:hypothetical protein